jgi:cell division protein ZipA
MQASWSIVLNVLLLIVVFIAIGRMLRSRYKNAHYSLSPSPSLGREGKATDDDIVSIRKISMTDDSANSRPVIAPQGKPGPVIKNEDPPSFPATPSSVMMFLSAKEDRQLAGYELLQTVLACGLRFGEGNLFHRHQFPNGQGPVLCSLAAATPSGVFDMQNIGAFRVRGLCLFMQSSGNPSIDGERFEIMLDTAKQLSEGLDAHLLDDQQKILKDLGIMRYYHLLNLNERNECVEP